MTTVLERYVVNQFPLAGAEPYDGGGVATIRLSEGQAGQFVEIERIVIDAVSGATFDLFAITADGGNLQLRDHAGAALLASDAVQVSDENSLARFWPNEPIIARFTGGTPGDVPTVYIQAVAVVYLSKELPEGGAQAITEGLHDVGATAAPDPGGWN